jgi:hypothetical protein
LWKKSFRGDLVLMHPSTAQTMSPRAKAFRPL